MNQELVNFLINQGVAISVLCFFLWYMVKPLITVYIDSIKSVTESMKKQTEIMIRSSETSNEKFNEIIEQIHSSKNDIINAFNKIK